MIVGQKVGYARVSTNAQDLSLQRERLADCDRILKKRFSAEKEPYGQHLMTPWPTFAMARSLSLPSLIVLLVLFTT